MIDDDQAEEAAAPEPVAEPSEHPEFAERSLRILEALLFASSEPLSAKELSGNLDEGADTEGLLTLLAERYSARGVNLVRRGDKWAFRTAGDLGFLLRRDETESRNLSRAALETLAIIAYHQPATRAEVEEVRGVATGKGTLDLLMEAGWVRMRGRRRTPGRPVTYGTTENFLDHFSLESLADLPGLEELKGAGLLSNRLPASMQVPLPFDGPLREDEDPLDPEDLAHPETVTDEPPEADGEPETEFEAELEPESLEPEAALQPEAEAGTEAAPEAAAEPVIAEESEFEPESEVEPESEPEGEPDDESGEKP